MAQPVTHTNNFTIQSGHLSGRPVLGRANPAQSEFAAPGALETNRFSFAVMCLFGCCQLRKVVPPSGKGDSTKY